MTSGPYQVMPDLTAEETLALRASIEEFGVLVPVVRDEFGVTIDGHHRAVIAEDLGITYEVETRTGLSDAEKRTLAYELNSHRRQLDFAKRRSMVAHSLKLDPSLSDRAHAARLHVDHKTVALARRSMIRTGELPALEALLGKDGKARPAGTTEEPTKPTGESPQLAPPGVDPDTGEIIEDREPPAPVPSGGEEAAPQPTPTVAPDADSAPASGAEAEPGGSSSPNGEEDPEESRPSSGSENEARDEPPVDRLSAAIQARPKLNKALAAMPADVVALLDPEGRQSWQRTVDAVADWVDAWSDALSETPTLTIVQGAAS